MAYPSRPRMAYDNTEATINPPATPMAAAPQAPQVVGAMGGAPKIQPWARTDATSNSVTIPPSPFSLNDIGSKYKPLVDRVKTSMQAQMASLPEGQRQARFWQGFQQYPEAMAQMIVRRVLTNQYYNEVSRGPVGQWMSWLEGM